MSFINSHSQEEKWTIFFFLINVIETIDNDYFTNINKRVVEIDKKDSNFQISLQTLSANKY